MPNSVTRYKPFGEIRYPSSGSNSLPTDRTFTGQRSEKASFAGSLMDYGARFYSPLLGRFISADTLVPQPGDPQRLNRYSYALGNPLKYTDPTGHDVDCVAGDTVCRAQVERDSWFAYLDRERQRCASGGPDCPNYLDLFSFLFVAITQPEVIVFKIAEYIGQERSGGEIEAASVPVVVASVGAGWKPGDSVNQLNTDGSYPTWEEARSRYWINRALTASPEEFSEQNLALMRQGNAPKMRVMTLSNETGQIQEQLVEKEIHHIFGREIGDPHSPVNLMEAWPWEHAAMDPYRYTGYTLLENWGIRYWGKR